jgi:hypothetical protein
VNRKRTTPALLAAGLLVGTAVIIAGAPAGATGNSLHRSQGTTLDMVKQQQAAESGRDASTGKTLKKPVTSDLMAGMAMTDATTSSAVTGPTNLATNVGGSWSNAAFTIPQSAHAASSNGSSGAVHAVQLYDGKVLIMAGSGNQWENLQAGDWTSWLWDPSQPDQSKAWKFIKTPYDMFCAGHVELANGNILIAGGTVQYPQYDANNNLVHDWVGSKQAYIFNVQTEQYQAISSMNGARWYPSLVTAAGGKVVAVGGLDNDNAAATGLVTHNNDTPELFDPATNSWSVLPSMNFTTTDPATTTTARTTKTTTTRTFGYYPGMVLTADGRLFYSGESNGDNGIPSGFWDYLTGKYTSTGTLPFLYQRNAGATVLLPPAQSQKVMVMGGGDMTLVATNDTEVMDLGSGTWSKGPAMSAAKMYVGAVVLPDYTVFETNGAANFRVNGVHTAEIYSPASNAFTVMNSPTEDRLYHSNAFLQPDGTVAVMGSQPLDGSFNMHIAVYSPPYLFKGQRPTVTGPNHQFDYSGNPLGGFAITTAPGTTVAKASLVRPSATTHSTDPDQRLVDLKVTNNGDGTYSLTAPTNSNIAPAGQYMLFVTDSNGVPSVADWVSIGTAYAGSGGGVVVTPTPTPTTTSPSPSVTPSASATGTPAPTTSATTPGIVLSATQKDWVATLTATSSAPGDLVLQSQSGTTWVNDTNKPTVNGVSTFTWGGGTPTTFRVVLPGSTLVSNTVTVPYGAGSSGPFGGAGGTPTPTPTTTGARTLAITENEANYVATFTIQSSWKSGQTINLQENVAGTWTKVQGWGSDGTGKIVITHGSPGGTFQFRAEAPAAGAYAESFSPVISVTYP